jgi:hypothetical protein
VWHFANRLLAGLGALGADVLQQDELQLVDLVSFDHCKEVRTLALLNDNKPT